MRGNKLIVPIKAVAFVVKGEVSEEIKLERLRLFLDQEAVRTRSSFDVDGKVLQGRVEGKDEFFFYNGPKGVPLSMPDIPATD